MKKTRTVLAISSLAALLLSLTIATAQLGFTRLWSFGGTLPGGERDGSSPKCWWKDQTVHCMA